MNTDNLLLKKEKEKLLEDIIVSLRMQAVRESDKRKIETVLQKAIMREADPEMGLSNIPGIYKHIRASVLKKSK